MEVGIVSVIRDLFLFAFLHFRPTLSDFEFGVGLANHVDAAATSDHLAILVTFFHLSDGTDNLHTKDDERFEGSIRSALEVVSRRERVSVAVAVVEVQKGRWTKVVQARGAKVANRFGSRNPLLSGEGIKESKRR